jgi:hypothetical protein
MFKKIHSNRDPQDTVFSELKKEFRAYFDAAGTWFISFIDRYPNFLFGAMIILMLVSFALSFTVFRLREIPVKIQPSVKVRRPEPVSDGFDRILQAGAALKETIALKKLVDSITAKPTLSRADSTALENALDRLQQINKQLNVK